MIEWFEDLSLGMRFKSETVQISEDEINSSPPGSIRSRFIWTMKLPERQSSRAWQHPDGTPPPSQCVLQYKRTRSAPIPSSALGLTVFAGCCRYDPAISSVSKAKSSA